MTHTSLRPLTAPTVNVLTFSEYRLQRVGGMPLTWRCLKGIRFIGIVFEHPTHWSNGVDSIAYAEPEDAVLGLGDFLAVSGRERAAQRQGEAIAA